MSNETFTFLGALWVVGIAGLPIAYYQWATRTKRHGGRTDQMVRATREEATQIAEARVRLLQAEVHLLYWEVRKSEPEEPNIVEVLQPKRLQLVPKPTYNGGKDNLGSVVAELKAS